MLELRKKTMLFLFFLNYLLVSLWAQTNSKEGFNKEVNETKETKVSKEIIVQSPKEESIHLQIKFFLHLLISLKIIHLLKRSL